MLISYLYDFLQRKRNVSAIVQRSETDSPPGGLGGLAPRGARIIKPTWVYMQGSTFHHVNRAYMARRASPHVNALHPQDSE